MEPSASAQLQWICQDRGLSSGLGRKGPLYERAFSLPGTAGAGELRLRLGSGGWGWFPLTARGRARARGVPVAGRWSHRPRRRLVRRGWGRESEHLCSAPLPVVPRESSRRKNQATHRSRSAPPHRVGGDLAVTAHRRRQPAGRAGRRGRAATKPRWHASRRCGPGRRHGRATTGPLIARPGRIGWQGATSARPGMRVAPGLPNGTGEAVKHG
jgi:hypothetical protein